MTRVLTATDTKALLRLASDLPKGSPERRAILAALRDNKGLDKVARGNTGDFASWVLTTRQGNPLSASEVREFLKGLGVPVFSGGGGGRKKPRFRVGDRFCVKAEKHKGQDPEGVYRKYDRMMGVVVDDSGGAKGAPVVMKMTNGDVVSFPDAQEKYRGVGLGKATDYSKMKGHGPIEIIYKANPGREPLPDQQSIAAEYVARGSDRGERRSLNYYSGYVLGAGDGKNGLYMRIMAQQRISADPCDEFFGIRSFNPNKGEVLYIGRLGKRPKGWEKEWAAIQQGL